MKVGFLTDYSREAIERAQRMGCTSLALGAAPGSALDVTKVNRARAAEIRQAMDAAGLEISVLGWHTNTLDPKRRGQIVGYMRRMIDLAAEMKVKAIACFAGRLPGKSIEESIPEFKKVFGPLAKHAESRRVRIAIENCPMFCGWPFHGMNIAYTPAAWDMMFDAVPSQAIGLEFDPSHLYWLHIDYIEAVHRYGERIYHVHAKDTEILHDRFAREGIYGTGWWRFRIPGWGDVDWQGFVGALLDVGYDGCVDVEHEDPVFHGPRYWEGMEMGIRFLRQYILG